MTLWLRSHFLLAALCLCSSAPAPEECPAAVAPTPLDADAVILGRWTVLMGFTDDSLVNALLNKTLSSYVNVTKLSSSTGEPVIQMSEDNNMNGKCIGMISNATFVDNTMTLSYANITSTFHTLPSGAQSLVLSGNTTISNLQGLLDFLGLDLKQQKEEASTYRSLYLMGRGSSAEDSDLQSFRQQARCLGFSGEPGYQYDSSQGFCTEASTRIH